ncbi:MAG: DUF4258 domain-containing protein [Candidatus Aenigmatarchaeota archaeon]
MDFKSTLSKYGKDDVVFSQHALRQMSDRNLEVKFVLDKLFDVKSIAFEQWNEGNRTFKIVYKHSGTYSIVIVASPHGGILTVVTVYKTNKAVQKLIEKGGAIHIMKRI